MRQTIFLCLIAICVLFNVAGCITTSADGSVESVFPDSSDDMAEVAAAFVVLTSAVITDSVVADVATYNGTTRRTRTNIPGSSYNLEAPNGSIYYKTSDGRVVMYTGSYSASKKRDDEKPSYGVADSSYENDENAVAADANVVDPGVGSATDEVYCGMDEAQFMALKSDLESGKDVKKYSPLPSLSAEQAAALLLLVTDESQRIEIAVAMYGFVCDKENWYLVYNAISSESGQQKLEEELSKKYGMQ